MASRNPPPTPPTPPPPPPPPLHSSSHPSSAAVYEDIRIHFPRLLQQASTPDLSAAALAAADLPLPPSPSVSTHRLLHPASAQQAHYHSLNPGGRGHAHAHGHAGSSSPNPSFRGLPRRMSAASGESHSLPLFAAATARASSALASTMPSLLHRRAVVGLIVADLVMSVGVFAAIAANATVALPPESSLWSRLAPTLDLAVLNLVRGLALVWLVIKGWLPVSPTTLTMSTALYAAGKAMSLLTSPSPTAPTSLISLYTCYSLVLPLVESLHLRAALASFASRRSSVTPSTMTPPTPIRASTIPSNSSSSAPGGDTRYASHRSSRRTQRPPVTTATFASGANRPLLDEADSRDYRTFLGAPPTAKQVARAAQRRDSVGPGEGEAGSAASHRQHQLQQAQQQQQQQQQQSRRLIRAPWLSDILAGLTGHRPIPPPLPPPPPPAPHPSFIHDDWGRSRSHSHSGALLSPRSHALAFGHPHPPPTIHHYTSLADPPLQRTRRPNSGLMHPPSLNPARWSLATFDSADLARLSSAVQPWAAQYASVESAPQPSLRHPPGMNAGVDEAGAQSMRAVRAQSSASSSTYDSEAEDDQQTVGSPPPPVPVYHHHHHHHHHARPHRSDPDTQTAGYKRYRPAPLTPHFRSLSMSHLGSPSPVYYSDAGNEDEVVISPVHEAHPGAYDHQRDDSGHIPAAAAAAAAAAADAHPPAPPALAINTSMLASPPTPSASHSNPSTAPPTPFGTYSPAAQKLARPAEASFRSGAATVGGDSRTLARGGGLRHPPRGHARNRSSASMAAMASSDDGAGGEASYEYGAPVGVGASAGVYHHHHHRLSSYSHQSATSGVGDEEDEVSSSDRGVGGGALVRAHRQSYMYDDDEDEDDDEPPGSAKDTATVYSALSAHLYRPAAAGYYQGHHAGADSSRSGSGNQSPLVYHPSQDLVALAVDSGAGTGTASGAGAGGWMAAATSVASGRHVASPGTVGGRSFVTAPSGSMSIGTFRVGSGGVPPPPPPPPPPMMADEHPGAFRRLSESLKRALYGAEIQLAFASTASRPALASTLTDLAQLCRSALDTDEHSHGGQADAADIQLTLAACHLYLAALAAPDPSWSAHWWIVTRTIAHVGGSSAAPAAPAAADIEAWHALADWMHAAMTRTGDGTQAEPAWVQKDAVWRFRQGLMSGIMCGR